MPVRRFLLAAAIALFALAMLRIERHWQGPVVMTINGDNGLHVGDLVVLAVAAVAMGIVLVRRPS